GVLLDVEIDVWLSVASQKGPETQGVRRVARSNQHEPAQGVVDEVRVAEGEGAQEQLAQLGIRLNDVPEVRLLDLERRRRIQRAGADQASPPGDHVHLAGELPGRMNRDALLPFPGRAGDLDAPLQQDVERAL